MTATKRQVSTATQMVLDLAAWMVPAGHRPRYRSEFGAELHDVPPGERFGYAVSVLLHAPALRSALAATPAPAAEPVVRTRKPLRCRLGRHRWRIERTEDGKAFEHCVRCGKDHPGGYTKDPSWGEPYGPDQRRWLIAGEGDERPHNRSSGAAQRHPRGAAQADSRAQ